MRMEIKRSLADHLPMHMLGLNALRKQRNQSDDQSSPGGGERQGHELRRPIADILRDGIYELRPSYQGVNYRILYFFSGKNIVVISHGLSKKAKVPAIEIDRAIERKNKYEANPEVHGVKR